MPQLLIYSSSAEIPRKLESQIRALLQDEWPGPDVGDNAGPLIEPQLHPTYFILVDANRLYSYARTIWATVAHHGQNFKLYGLGDVITMPKYRCRGYASQIIQEATAQIRSDPEADAAVLLTEPRLEPLYRRSGWEYVNGLHVMSGERQGHETSDEFAMMLFVSASAHTARESFTSQSLILPGDEW